MSFTVGLACGMTLSDVSVLHSPPKAELFKLGLFIIEYILIVVDVRPL